MNCPDKVLVTLDLNDSLIFNTIKEDSLQIADYFLQSFKDNGVAHLAFQVVNNNVLQICLYTESGLNPIAILKTIEIPFKAEMGIEENWETYLYYVEKK